MKTTTVTAVKVPARVYYPSIFLGTFASLVGLFTAAAAMIQLILVASNGLPFSATHFITTFPSCNTWYQDTVWNDNGPESSKADGDHRYAACISPIINSKFILAASAGVTFVLAMSTVLLPFRGRLPFLTIIDPLFSNGPMLLYLFLGFLILGTAGVVGFSAGILCFFVCLCYLLLFFFERNALKDK